MKDRESIELSEHICRSFIDQDYEEYDENEDLGFEYITQDTTYTDMEKSYTTEDVVLKRNLDNRYFKFSYYESSYRSLFEDVKFPIIATEVFPKIIKTTIYE